MKVIFEKAEKYLGISYIFKYFSEGKVIEANGKNSKGSLIDTFLWLEEVGAANMEYEPKDGVFVVIPKYSKKTDELLKMFDKKEVIAAFMEYESNPGLNVPLLNQVIKKLEMK